MLFAETVEAVMPLVRALRWPLVIIFSLLLFRRPIAGFIEDVENLVVKTGDIEAVAKREGFEAGENYRAALEAKSDGEDVESAPKMGESTFEALRDANLLWVDDRPQNNMYEQKALKILGANIDLAQTTEEALDHLNSNEYDVVLSDMGRPRDDRAGYTLLEEKKQRNDETPFIIYSTSNKKKHKQEARRRGAVGSTNRPDELFQLIEDALVRPKDT